MQESSGCFSVARCAETTAGESVSLSTARLTPQRVMFLVLGTAKRAAVARWQAGAKLPASAVASEGCVEVLVEAAAMVEGNPQPKG